MIRRFCIHCYLETKMGDDAAAPMDWGDDVISDIIEQQRPPPPPPSRKRARPPGPPPPVDNEFIDAGAAQAAEAVAAEPLSEWETDDEEEEGEERLSDYIEPEPVLDPEFNPFEDYGQVASQAERNADWKRLKDVYVKNWGWNFHKKFKFIRMVQEEYNKPGGVRDYLIPAERDREGHVVRRERGPPWGAKSIWTWGLNNMQEFALHRTMLSGFKTLITETKRKLRERDRNNPARKRIKKEAMAQFLRLSKEVRPWLKEANHGLDQTIQ